MKNDLCYSGFMIRFHENFMKKTQYAMHLHVNLFFWIHSNGMPQLIDNLWVGEMYWLYEGEGFSAPREEGNGNM